MGRGGKEGRGQEVRRGLPRQARGAGGGLRGTREGDVRAKPRCRWDAGEGLLGLGWGVPGDLAKANPVVGLGEKPGGSRLDRR